MEINGTIKKAQRVAMLSGGFMLRGSLFGYDVTGQYREGWYLYTAKVVEEIETDVFRTETDAIYRVESWKAPSRTTAQYDNIPADWPVPPRQETQEITTS